MFKTSNQITILHVVVVVCDENGALFAIQLQIAQIPLGVIWILASRWRCCRFYIKYVDGGISGDTRPEEKKRRRSLVTIHSGYSILELLQCPMRQHAQKHASRRLDKELITTHKQSTAQVKCVLWLYTQILYSKVSNDSGGAWFTCSEVKASWQIVRTTLCCGAELLNNLFYVTRAQECKWKLIDYRILWSSSVLLFTKCPVPFPLPRSLLRI